MCESGVVFGGRGGFQQSGPVEGVIKGQCFFGGSRGGI